MAVAKKTISQKKPSINAKSLRVVATVKKPLVTMNRRIKKLLARRPHRSFRSTRRRDYTRSLKLSGYWAFTNAVRKIVWKNKRLFGLLALVYALLTLVLVGMASQDTYTSLNETLQETTGEIFQGNWGELGKAGLLLTAGVTGSFTQTLSEGQQIYSTLLLLLTWLTTVWLLRGILAGRTPRLRDGLYNAGAPILATFLVGLLFLVQLLPLALAVVGYSAAVSVGLLAGGVEAMLFWTVALLLGALSLYWMTSTFIAMAIVTLPGMYPMQAIRTAGDLVIGRRLRILLRILWMLVTVAVVWVVIMVPIILLDTWLKSVLSALQWLPIVPVVLLIMSTLSVLWSASYVYLLYRRIVDDDAAPA
jgi:hypothetical protein